MKKLLSFLILSLYVVLSLYCSVQTDRFGNSEKSYRLAEDCYELKDYGKSLKYAEDAILFRKQKIDYETDTLNNSLSSKAVLSAGDKIDEVLKILIERKENDSISIINSYLNKKGIAYFDNSMEKLLSYMNSLSVFPEAQKLIGDIYKLEGEYEFAEKYYLDALNNSAVLDVPSEKFNILYLLAEISEFEKDYDAYEIRLLNILTEDSNFKDSALADAMINTIESNDALAVKKFFNLYRSDSYMSLRAYILLADYYFSIKENKKALKFSALAVITSYTKINQSLKSRNIEYNAISLDTFLQECMIHNDIVKWGSENLVWESYTSFAKICIANGYNNFAKELLTILVKYLPEPYWQKDAVLILESIN